MIDYSLDELCAVACAEAWRDDGEILASPIGVIPSIGARLAKETFAPDLLLTDGIASLVANTLPLGAASPAKVVEGYAPYRTIFDIVWSGRRHVMMGASQIDRFGNQNIAFIGDPRRPKAQLLGMRGAPGNTINHPTSYFIPNHSVRSFVAKVDAVSGVGYDRAAALGARASRYHHLRRVISNKGVFDFETPDHAMRLRSVHPGVAVEEIVAATGFALVIPPDCPPTRAPTAEELRLLREVIDPTGLGKKELGA
ncbi:MAG TPA: CoA-transferase [Polyangiaceae bacterium]|jgi:acyl CoA:acetate/3-ketoacid CoA transferase beta subunit|nr:CoA-transferase [Polyangiaceae bacterium]